MSALTERLLTRSTKAQDDAYAIAKKNEALALQSFTDPQGNPTQRSYELAAEFILPFTASDDTKDALDAQARIKKHENSLTGLTESKTRQSKSVADFQRQEYDAYFSNRDEGVVSYRDTSLLLANASEELNTLTLGVIDAIETDRAAGRDTDELDRYLNELSERTRGITQLNERAQSGSLGVDEFVGSYGYYLDTDPDTGQIRGASIMPIGFAPSGLEDGFARSPETTRLEQGIMPVYMPTGQNIDGSKTMRMGNLTWEFQQGAGYVGDKNARKAFEGDGSFNISGLDNSRVYPTASEVPERGSFRNGIIGTDDGGNAIYNTLYFGQDGKSYNVDDNTRQKMMNDPTFSRKLRGHIPTMRAQEFARLNSDSTQLDAPDATPFRQFGRDVSAEQPIQSVERQRTIQDSAQGFFGNRKNRQNVPDKPRTGNIAADIIDKGKSFFSKQTTV